jgi:hypothetical protein
MGKRGFSKMAGNNAHAHKKVNSQTWGTLKPGRGGKAVAANINNLLP